VVPPEKAAISDLRARCSGCQAVFFVALAHPAEDPAPAPSPPVAPTPSAPSVEPGAGKPAEAPHARAPVPWRRCTNHPQSRSENVCTACGKGWCKECGKKVQNAVLCPACEGLCVAAEEREEEEARASLRARPLLEDVRTIAAYPFTDPTAYVMLSIVVGLFGMLSGLSGYAVLFSQGILMAYAFSALMRASNGRLEGYMPDIGDVADLVVPLRLGFVAFLASSWPLILIAFLSPGAALFGAPREGGEATSAGVKLLLVLALLWKLVYSPVALTVAGISRSMLQTLNPLVGAGAIARMGPVYWQAMAIYGALAVGQWLVDWPLGFIPILGSILAGFVDSYANLCIGCALGLAVFKKARELGLE